MSSKFVSEIAPGILIFDRYRVKRGDIIRYRYTQPGAWQRYFSAMVVHVDTYEIDVVTDRGQNITFKPEDEAESDFSIIFKTSDDEIIALGEQRFTDMTEEELEALPDVTKAAIQRKEKAAQARQAKQEDDTYRENLFAKNARRNGFGR